MEFHVRDKVLLKLTPRILKKISNMTRQRGLIPKFEGPFEVIKKVGEFAYMLRLPERLKLHHRKVELTPQRTFLIIEPWGQVERIGEPIILFSGKIVRNQMLHGSKM